jgi:diacylglycerol O-acyltransferase / wax synthase
VAELLCRLPLALTTTLFGGMLRGIDFVTSNVPGPRFDVFLAGARVEGVVGYGPLTGAATNVTLFSLRDQAHLGISMDPAAISDPELFVASMRDGFAEVLGS